MSTKLLILSLLLLPTLLFGQAGVQYSTTTRSVSPTNLNNFRASNVVAASKLAVGVEAIGTSPIRAVSLPTANTNSYLAWQNFGNGEIERANTNIMANVQLNNLGLGTPPSTGFGYLSVLNSGTFGGQVIINGVGDSLITAGDADINGNLTVLLSTLLAGDFTSIGAASFHGQIRADSGNITNTLTIGSAASPATIQGTNGGVEIIAAASNSVALRLSGISTVTQQTNFFEIYSNNVLIAYASSNGSFFATLWGFRGDEDTYWGHPAADALNVVLGGGEYARFAVGVMHLGPSYLGFGAGTTASDVRFQRDSAGVFAFHNTTTAAITNRVYRTRTSAGVGEWYETGYDNRAFQNWTFFRAQGATNRIAFGVGTNAAVMIDSTNNVNITKALTVGPTPAYITNILAASAVLDFPDTAAQTHADLPLTVTGTTTNDTANLGVPFHAIMPNSSYSCYTSNDTVWVRFLNVGVLSRDPAGTLIQVMVFKRAQ